MTELKFEITNIAEGATIVYTLPEGVTDIAAELYKRDANLV